MLPELKFALLLPKTPWPFISKNQSVLFTNPVMQQTLVSVDEDDVRSEMFYGY